MNRLQTSLRLRLLVLILVPLILVSSAAVFWRYSIAKQTAEEIFDRNLLMLTLAISRDVTLSEGDSLSETTSNLFRQASGGEVYYNVYGPDGSFVTGYSSPPVRAATTQSPANTPILFDAVHLGQPVRVVKLIETATVDGLSGNLVVTVWQRLELRELFVRNLATRAAVLAGILVLTVGGLVFFGIRLGLRPLSELEQAIQKRSSDDLRPILRQVPRETDGIVSRLNTLFGQVTQATEARDRFISNAAHQLRNPIAGIHSMAQATKGAETLKDSKKRAAELVDETRRMGRLTEQLLSLERLDGRTPSFTSVDLNDLLTDVGQRNGAKILTQGKDFSITQSATPIQIKGDTVLLSEAVENLVDNALRHGGTSMTFISLTVVKDERNGKVIVENDGSTISADDSEIIFDRFTQSAESQGSGLGLAICSEIARIHGGKIDLKIRPTTQFSLILPIL